MKDSGWIPNTQSPIAAGIAPDAAILIWHVFQGVMVGKCEEWKNNRFFSHWKTVGTDWVSAKDRKPRREDADVYSCVISRNEHGEVGIAGWHRFEREPALMYWQSPPEPPADFRELRNKAF